MRNFQFALTGLAATALVFGCGDSTSPRPASRPAVAGPSFTAASGFSGRQLARGNAGAFHIQSKADGYDIEIKAKDDTDVGVTELLIAAGGHSGWHSHPGPVLVVVKSGTITLYHESDPNCSPNVYPAGTTFIELGGRVHIARNEGSVPVEMIATFFAPPFPAPARIDEPAPENCAF